MSSDLIGSAPVLVDQYAEDSVTSDQGVAGDDSDGIVGWWILAQVLVWPVAIEMANVLIKNSVGMSRVVNQHPVGAFGSYAAEETFHVAVRPGACGEKP